jgi:hypothetical protein
MSAPTTPPSGLDPADVAPGCPRRRTAAVPARAGGPSPIQTPSPSSLEATTGRNGLSSLQELLDRPELAYNMAPAEARKLLPKLVALAETARIAAGQTHAVVGNGPALLTATEAGKRLGLTAKQVYRRADRWPFTRRLGPKTPRFDAAGLEMFLGRPERP